MDIRKEALVPRAMFDQVDETESCDYASVQGVATRWHVLGPLDGSAYYVVPDYMGPRGAMSNPYDCWVVVPDDHRDRGIRHALSNAAFQAAVGIASGMAAEAVYVESL